LRVPSGWGGGAAAVAVLGTVVATLVSRSAAGAVTAAAGRERRARVVRGRTRGMTILSYGPALRAGDGSTLPDASRGPVRWPFIRHLLSEIESCVSSRVESRALAVGEGARAGPAGTGPRTWSVSRGSAAAEGGELRVHRPLGRLDLGGPGVDGLRARGERLVRRGAGGDARDGALAERRAQRHVHRHRPGVLGRHRDVRLAPEAARGGLR